jgi:hypothetical protein
MHGSENKLLANISRVTSERQVARSYEIPKKAVLVAAREVHSSAY